MQLLTTKAVTSVVNIDKPRHSVGSPGSLAMFDGETSEAAGGASAWDLTSAAFHALLKPSPSPALSAIALNARMVDRNSPSMMSDMTPSLRYAPVIAAHFGKFGRSECGVVQ